MTITYLPQDEETRKHNEAIDEQMAIQARHLKKRECIKWLIERMKRRAQGRERMKMAERKRRIKAAKQNFGLTEVWKAKMRKPMGLVDDAEYGEALHLGCRPWTKKEGV